jgi:hypothetical protein
MEPPQTQQDDGLVEKKKQQATAFERLEKIMLDSKKQQEDLFRAADERRARDDADRRAKLEMVGLRVFCCC